MTDLALAVQNVKKHFSNTRSPALSGLSFEIKRGEIYALFGPNGAGKTTAINIIMGFLRADEGNVLVDGISVAKAPTKARQNIAYLPETVSLYPMLNGVENLHYFALLAGHKLNDEKCRDLLVQSGLPQEAHERKARFYSKGMRQKVAVAIALAKKAQLLVLDEPTSGLDPNAAADLSRTLVAATERGIAVLMATHDIWRVNEVANIMGILHQGKIVEQINPTTYSTSELEKLYIQRLAS